MSRKKILILLGLVAAVTVAGCSNTDTTEEAQTTASTTAEQADEEDDADAQSDDADIAAADEETEAETEASLDPITPSDYLVENITDYATLGDLSDLEVTQYDYEITDDVIEEEIEAELSSYSEEVEVDRASEDGDVVYVEMTSSIQGVEDSETLESTYFYIGDEEYGAEFDSEITGVSTGDTVTFSITFDDEIWIDEWVDETVDFQLDITSVCEVELPEYDDDFVTTYTEYSSVEEYEEALRQTLEEEYNESSRYDAIETLFETVAEYTVFSGYPDDLYEQCKQELLSFYSIFAGTTDEDEICELFGLSSEDLDLEIVDTVNRRLLVSAICTEYGLEVSEDDYVAYVTAQAEDYGYDSAAEFEEESTRESLVWELYDTLAGEYLYENATVTEEMVDSDEEEYWDETEDVEDEYLDETEDLEDEYLDETESPE